MSLAEIGNAVVLFLTATVESGGLGRECLTPKRLHSRVDYYSTVKIFFNPKYASLSGVLRK